MDLHPDDRRRWIALAQTFHCLAEREDVAAFDLEALAAWAATGASPAERAVCRFAFGVIRQPQPDALAEGGPFDVLAAWPRSDDRHRAAFLDWCRDPVYF